MSYVDKHPREFWVWLLCAAAVIVLILYLGHRAEECELQGGTLVKGVWGNVKCVKVAK